MVARTVTLTGYDIPFRIKNSSWPLFKVPYFQDILDEISKAVNTGFAAGDSALFRSCLFNLSEHMRVIGQHCWDYSHMRDAYFAKYEVYGGNSSLRIPVRLQDVVRYLYIVDESSGYWHKRSRIRVYVNNKPNAENKALADFSGNVELRLDARRMFKALKQLNKYSLLVGVYASDEALWLREPAEDNIPLLPRRYMFGRRLL